MEDPRTEIELEGGEHSAAYYGGSLRDGDLDFILPLPKTKASSSPHISFFADQATSAKRETLRYSCQDQKGFWEGLAQTLSAGRMGLWSSSDKPSPPAPKISSDGAPIAPDRSQRAKCWEARDAYFSCLDKNAIVDSITEKAKAEKGCAVEGRGFEANCASSWVTYFKKRRVMEYQRNQTLEKLKAEGATQMPGQIGPPVPGQRP